MKWICQLGDGWMLAEDGANLKRIHTGYPYPDTEEPQMDMLYNLLEFCYQAGVHRLVRYIRTEATFKRQYYDIVQKINERFITCNVDTMYMTDVFGEGMVGGDCSLIADNGKMRVYKAPDTSENRKGVVSLIGGVSSSKYIYIFAPYALESNLAFSTSHIKQESYDDLDTVFHAMVAFTYSEECFFLQEKGLELLCKEFKERKLGRVAVALCRQRYKDELRLFYSRWSNKDFDVTSLGLNLRSSAEVFNSIAPILNSPQWEQTLRDCVCEECNTNLLEVFRFTKKKNTRYDAKTGIFSVKLHPVFSELAELGDFKITFYVGRIKFTDLAVFKECYIGYSNNVVMLDLKRYIGNLDLLNIFMQSVGFKTFWNSECICNGDNFRKVFGVTDASWGKLIFFKGDLAKRLALGTTKQFKNVPSLFNMLVWLEGFGGKAGVLTFSKRTTYTFTFFSEFKNMLSISLEDFVLANRDIFLLLAIRKLNDNNKAGNTFYTMNFENAIVDYDANTGYINVVFDCPSEYNYVESMHSWVRYR